MTGNDGIGRVAGPQNFKNRHAGGRPFQIVRVAARWKFNGIPQELRGADEKPGRVFSIAINSASTDDNTVGKAERKGYRAIYEQIHGSDHTIGAFEPDEVADPLTEALTKPEERKSRTDALAAKLEAAAAEKDADGRPMPTDDMYSQQDQERRPGEDG